MSTLQIVLAIGLVPFLLALALNLPRLFRAVSAARGLYLLGMAWIAAALSQARFLDPEKALDEPVSVSTGEYYQIGWMVLAGLITIYLLLAAPRLGRATRLPLIALGAYALLGVLSAPLAPVPLLSIYKASQVLVVAMLAIVTLAYMTRREQPRMALELVYFMLTAIVTSAAIGGVFFPAIGFAEIHGGGAFGAALRGVFPQLQQNELGLLSAIVVVVATRRVFEDGAFITRIYYLTLTMMSFSVLFAAQARTSLASSIIAIILMSLAIKRLRWAAGVMGIVAFSAMAYYLVSGGELGFEDAATTYLRRGQTDTQLSTMSGRTVLWELGMKMVADSPVIGHGFQTGARFGGQKYGVAQGSNMHSSHVQVLVDSGLLGYLTWIIFLVSIAGFLTKRAFHHFHASSDIARLHIEVWLVMFVILFRSFAGNVLVTHQMNLLVFVSLYLFTAAYMLASKASPQDSANRLVTKPAIAPRSVVKTGTRGC